MYNNSESACEGVASMSNYRDTYAGKTVLVTGGAGAIGSNLTP